LSGKDIYLGLHGSKVSRDNYDRVVGEWLAAGRNVPRGQGPAGTSLIELLNAFRKAGDVPPSHADDFKAVMKIMVRLYGRTPIADFGPLALKVVREQMVAAGWKRKTIAQRIHSVRRIFRWGVEHQMVDESQLAALKALEPLKAGKTAAPESLPVQPVAIEHVEACLPFMSPTVAAMVRLQMLTGMRAGEVCQMRTGDIDTSGPVWVYRPGSHKTAYLGKVREIALGKRAIKVLGPLLLTDLNAPIFSPLRADAERRAALSANRKTPAHYGNGPGTNRKSSPERTPGDQYDTNAYRRAINYATARAFPPPAALARAKGETAAAWRERLGPKWADLTAFRKSVHWHPHQLRHTFATLVRKQFGLDHAQKALGHSHAAITERYAAVALEKAIEVAQVIG
jgi:integrase